MEKCKVSIFFCDNVIESFVVYGRMCASEYGRTRTEQLGLGHWYMVTVI